MLASVVTHGGTTKTAQAALGELRLAYELFEKAEKHGGRAVKFLVRVLLLNVSWSHVEECRASRSSVDCTTRRTQPTPKASRLREIYSPPALKVANMTNYRFSVGGPEQWQLKQIRLHASARSHDVAPGHPTARRTPPPQGQSLQTLPLLPTPVLVPVARRRARRYHPRKCFPHWKVTEVRCTRCSSTRCGTSRVHRTVRLGT